MSNYIINSDPRLIVPLNPYSLSSINKFGYYLKIMNAEQGI